MKVTVVVDNSVPPSARLPFLAEHGLALLLEDGSTRILFDTGQTGIVVHNLGLLGIHPSSLDAIVISHGHYDHTGGLMAILQHAGKALPVYGHEDIFQTRVSVAGKRRSIGIPFPRPLLTELGAAWRLSKQPVEVMPGLWFSGQVPRTTAYEMGDPKLLTFASDGKGSEDPILDDGSLFRIGDRGLQVIGGCAHAGLINTVRFGLGLTGASRLHAWLGGTHLGPAGPLQRSASLDALEALAPELIAANHCTGFAMMAALQHRFGERFIPAMVGTVIHL